MTILRRKAPAAKVDARENEAEPIVHQRIEITVEREWISMLVRKQAGATRQEPAREQPGAEEPLLELPPPAPALKDRNSA